jgi:hypothetical protein
MLWMTHEQIQGKFGIGVIIFGPAGRNASRYFVSIGGGYRKEHKEHMLLWRIDNRPLRQFEYDGDRDAESMEHGINPCLDAIDLM